LIISTIADLEAAATTYTSAATNVETITTLGTFAAPTASKCRFREVDATNFPGVYEIHIADARFAVANTTQLLISIQCTGVAPVYVEYQLIAVDLMDTVRFGLTAIPNVAQGTVGSLPTATATGQVTVATNNDKSSYSLTVTPPTALEIWHVAASSVVTAGTIGLQLKTNIDAAVTTRMASFTYTAPPSVTDIWNTNISAYSSAGFAGTYLKNAMPTFTYTAPPTVAQIWQTDVSGFSTTGQAGTYVKNAMPTFTYTAPPTVAQIWQTDVSGFSTVGQAGTYLKNAMPTFTYTAPPTVAQIWSNDISSYTSPTAGWACYQGLIEASASRSIAETMTVPAYSQAMADYLLGRNIAGGSDGGRTVKDALRALRNKSEIVGSTLTVYTENDTSTAWTAAVASSGSAVPVTGIDPA
jgi:hypothetical protein